MNTTAPTVQLYFDPISPYVWLAFKRLDELQAAGLHIDCRPVLFAGLLNAHGQKGPAEIIDALLWRLRNPAGDNERLSDFLSRGASAQRRIPGS